MLKKLKFWESSSKEETSKKATVIQKDSKTEETELEENCIVFAPFTMRFSKSIFNNSDLKEVAFKKFFQQLPQAEIYGTQLEIFENVYHRVISPNNNYAELSIPNELIKVEQTEAGKKYKLSDPSKITEEMIVSIRTSEETIVINKALVEQRSSKEFN